MKPVFSSRARFLLIKLVLTAGIICILSGLGGITFADGLNDVMDDLMDEIRSDVNQDIKINARQKVSAENLSPSGGFSGIYVGLVEDRQTTCSLIITKTGATGNCNWGGVTAVIKVSGTSTDGKFFSGTYTITLQNPACSSGGIFTATLLSGTGEPGTTFKVTLTASVCFPMAENDAIMVKQ